MIIVNWLLHRLLLCIRIAASPRALVLIRRDAPALLLLPSFILAQTFPLTALFASSISVFLGRSAITAGLLLGALSNPTLLGAPQLPIEIDPSRPASFLLHIDDIRYPEVGRVQLNAKMLGLLSFKPSSAPELIKFKTTVRASLKAIHLPWRNSSLLATRSIVVARFVPRFVKTDQPPWSFESHMIRLGYSITGSIELVTEPLNGITDQSSLENEFPEEVTILNSLALGTRDVVSRETERLFRDLGLSHLLVFSGFQILLVASLASLLIKRCLCRIIPRSDILGAISGLLAASLLTHLSGWEPSGYRALIAYMYWSWTRHALGIFASPVQTIAVTFICVCLILPNAIWEVGIQLTFGALIGLLIAPSRSAIISALSATLITSMLTVLWFEQFVPAAFLLNVTVAPLMSFTGTVAAYPVLILIHAFPVLGEQIAYLLGDAHISTLYYLRSLLSSLGLSPIDVTSNQKWSIIAVSLGSIFILFCHITLRYFERNGISPTIPLKPETREGHLTIGEH